LCRVRCKPRDGVLRISFVTLQVKDVANTAFLKFRSFFSNAFENERVNTVARPGVVILQTFIDDEWQMALVSHLNGEVQGIVMAGTLKDLHPVKDIAVFGVFCGFVELCNPA
jgi:hypothetical protein